jgi:hypothetical protein
VAATRPFDAMRGFVPAVPDVGGGWRCFLEGFSEGGTDAAAVRAVVLYAAEARARGLVRLWRDFALRHPAHSPPRLRALTGAPWDPDAEAAAMRQIRDTILWSALTGPGHDPRDPFASSPPSIRTAWSC